MRICILSHFDSFQDSYALHVGWKERAKLLEYFGEDFDFLVNEGCPPDLYPRQKNILQNINANSPFTDRVKFFRRQYIDRLGVYDAILTADLIYQKRGNFLPKNQAMRDAAEFLPGHWFHWIHSGWIRRPDLVPYPESLRFEPMINSTLVYLNCHERYGVAEMFGEDPGRVRCVYNPKDFRSFNDFAPISWDITKMMDIPNKDIVQIFPHCSTRMNSKGIDIVAQVFAALKRQGRDVCVIFANGNVHSVVDEVEAKKKQWAEWGLVDRKDYVFTSELLDKKPLARRAVSDLFKVANLFVFPTWRETTGNIFQEAMISGNLLVLNKGVSCLREMGGQNAIYFDATHKIPGEADKPENELIRLVTYQPNAETYFDELAKKIIRRIPSRGHCWEFSFERIWFEQFRPLLYETINSGVQGVQGVQGVAGSGS